MQANTNYQGILQREYHRRKGRNPSYSLSAFARDIGLQGSKLSEILAHKKGLSEDRAKRVAGALRFGAAKAELFVTMVVAEHSRSPLRRKMALARLSEVGKMKKAMIDLEHFSSISDWYHFAIIELTRLKDFEPSAVWISRELGIPRKTATEALERLIKLKLLKNIDGRWTAGEEGIEVSDDVASRAIKEHHLQMLNKAKEAVPLHIHARELQSLNLAMDSDQIVEAKEMIRSFVEDFSKRFGQMEKPDRVYSLGLQFFPLTNRRSSSC